MIRYLHGDARNIDLPDESVDLIVTSPPYYGQRNYRDEPDQIGCEPHPQQYLENMWTVTRELWRVLKPGGSCWMNFGDKRAGSGAPGTTSGFSGRRPATGAPIPGQVRVQGARSGLEGGYTQAWFGRRKGKQMLPHRFAIGCMDGLADPEGIGWIVRQDQVWWKANGLPESATDRTQDKHEYWFHLTKNETYYSAIDEIREAQADVDPVSAGLGYERLTEGDPTGQDRTENTRGTVRANHPLGSVPPSVWKVATEALRVPEHLDVDHFAAFPSEWPRRLILGWSPKDVCTVCGEGRRPITERSVVFDKARDQEHASDIARRAVDRATTTGGTEHSTLNGQVSRQIIGHICACTPFTSHRGKRGDWTEGRTESADHGTEFGAGAGATVPRRPGGFGDKIPPPAIPMIEYHIDRWQPPASTPGIVLDPFSGTGTTAIVADILGRTGIGVELSADYLRLAEWRATDDKFRSKIRTRANTDLQQTLL